MIKDVCQLCDDDLERANEDTIDYCHKCQELKERESEVKHITSNDIPLTKRRMR